MAFTPAYAGLLGLGFMILAAAPPKDSGAIAAPEPLAREARPVSGFDRVILRGVGNLAIRQADKEALMVEAEPRVLRKLSSTVKDGVLYLDIVGNVSTQRPINYELTVKSLREVQSEGSGDVELRGVHSDKLELVLAGSGGIKASALKTGRLDASITGSGSIATAGEAQEQSLLISGAGDYEAEGLRSLKAAVDISGSGNAYLLVRDALKVNISGSGDVTYLGKPRVQQKISGAGEVSPR